MLLVTLQKQRRNGAPIEWARINLFASGRGNFLLPERSQIVT
jgi:hypothetical protein